MAVFLDDTIVAIATPPGRGGIGVVRLAGPEARAIACSMLQLKHELAAGRAIFGEVVEPASGERIDEAVVTYFAKPHSYTADDVVEISAHGAPVVLRHIVELAISRGVRLAEPGEFTMRAFLNGRIDLTQAEAVRDLIESQTLYQAKVAAQQLEGALSKRLQPIKKKLVELIAVMEAGIDFAEDDVAVLPSEEIVSRINEVQAPLEQLRASFAYGKIVHEGLTLAIVGRPNVGKSSLFNQLVERERAIVTATPGTTRDLVTETVSLGGIPIKLIDTAGIRHSTDEAESIGIRKSYEALSEADLVLVVLDSTQEISSEDKELLRICVNGRGLAVANKTDLAPDSVKILRESPKTYKTSAITGEGIDALRQAILEEVSGRSGGEQETGFLTNVRHQRLVEESLNGLEAATRAVEHKIPHEMIMLDLYGALRPLDAITGETTTDDILNLIFSSFCIGK
ncbi:MAG TPA: tRNA uridine-5-carboxymethylaminomethyl(34) synthesis GTPase MnmE [Candidatus Angelobacter sp.]|nr:tRNA uridine-5-carboxymethylaminomethyl(34) synthesis GTPase MnmE [Candidatus Angelobacter sp.]